MHEALEQLVDHRCPRCGRRERLDGAAAGIEDFFREAGRPASDDGPAPPLDEDEIARTAVAAPKYGLEAVAFD